MSLNRTRTVLCSFVVLAIVVFCILKLRPSETGNVQLVKKTDANLETGLKETLGNFVKTVGDLQSRLQTIEQRLDKIENTKQKIAEKVDKEVETGGGNIRVNKEEKPDRSNFRVDKEAKPGANAIEQDKEEKAHEGDSAGEIKQGRMCLDSAEQGAEENVVLFECHGEGRNQFFELDEKRLHHKGTCLAAKSVVVQSNIVMKQCDKDDAKQDWLYDNKHFKLDHNGLCMTAHEETVMLMQCRDNDKSQMWVYVPS